MQGAGVCPNAAHDHRMICSSLLNCLEITSNRQQHERDAFNPCLSQCQQLNSACNQGNCCMMSFWRYTTTPPLQVHSAYHMHDLL
jgi:hypothetical protein